MGKKTKIAVAIAAASAAAWAGTKAMAAPQRRESKQALTYDRPIVLAHRGGSHLAPEQTMAAFKNAADLGVDGFEIDIRLTKDEEIVVFHDEYIDRTCEASGRVADMTLEQLQQFNFGHHFVDLEGHFAYREKPERIVTLKELFKTFPNMFINIDMKDAPDTYEGGLMPSKLWRLIEECDATDRVVVTSFYDEQIDRFNLYAQNSVALGAGRGEVTKAYTAFTSQFKHLYNPKVDVFQIPRHYGSVIALDTKHFIQFLDQLNIPVMYWTIDDPLDMKELINRGARGIVTDRPDIAMQIIQER